MLFTLSKRTKIQFFRKSIASCGKRFREKRQVTIGQAEGSKAYGIRRMATSVVVLGAPETVRERIRASNQMFCERLSPAEI